MEGARQHGLHDIRRGGEPLQGASHKGGTQKGGSVPEPDFPGPEEEWLTTPGGVHRPQGCISFSPNSPQPPAIPEVLLERSDIRVSMPCIRAQQCSHKAIKASGSTPEKERNPLHDLSGLPDQSREVSPDPFSDNTCSLRAMAVVPSERDHHHSGAPTGGLQCGSRSRVPHPEVNRMDVRRQGVHYRLGPLTIDLFASRLNNQLVRYASWRPDQFAVQTDAFQMSWREEIGYAFPLSV